MESCVERCDSEKLDEFSVGSPLWSGLVAPFFSDLAESLGELVAYSICLLKKGVFEAGGDLVENSCDGSGQY